MPDSPIDPHRSFLLAADEKAVDSYDKTLVSLGGGALAVSFAFLKDIVGTTRPVPHTEWLMAAWVLWALTLMASLFSFLVSHYAIRRALQEYDNRARPNSKPGGWRSSATSMLNVLAGLFFVSGVGSMARFVWLILRG